VLWLTKTTFYCTVTRYTYFGVVADNFGTTAGMPMHVEISLITLLVLQCHKRVPTLENPPILAQIPVSLE